MADARPMTQRLVVDAATGTVQCPFRGAVPATACDACPNARGRTTHRGHDAVVCRAASRFFPSKDVSGW